MATLTLGQMLDAALGAPKTEAIDFEQLRNLLNGMLLQLGLRDVPVQESGEPVEGAEGGPFSASFLEELKQRVEANEKEIAEVRALCEELREEVSEMKVEQSRMAEDMQKMQESFNPESLQNLLDDLRNELLDTLTDMMNQGQGSPQDKASRRTHPAWEDRGLIVIGNEITLMERSRTPTPKHAGTRPVSPLPPRAGPQSRGKDFLQANASGHQASFRANDMGQNVGRNVGQNMGRNMGQNMGRNVGQNMGQNVGQNMGRNVRQNVGWNMGRNMGQNMGWNMGWNMGQNTGWSDMGWNMGQSDMEQRDTGQDMGWNMGRNMGQKDTGWNMGRSDRGQSDMGPSDTGQKGMGWNMGWNMGWSDMGWNVGRKDMGQKDMRQDDMGQIKDEEIKISISKAEALPSPLDAPPEMTDVGQIKDEETKMSISKAPHHIQTKTLDGGFTASRMHPGAPGTQLPVQRVQSARGQPGSQSLWIPAQSMAGTSSGLPTSRAARGGGSPRMEPYPAEAELRLLKVRSSEYSPCDPVVPLRRQHSAFIPARPPPSPGLSGRLPSARRQENRKQAVEGYSRRSPMYCGGLHTSTCPVQPMEPLLPDPNKPGAFDLVGRDGLVYRGRSPAGMD